MRNVFDNDIVAKMTTGATGAGLPGFGVLRISWHQGGKAGPIPASRTGNARVPTLLAIVLAYLLSQFFRSFLAILAPEMALELGLSASDLGRISAAWFVTFALAQFPIGWCLDRIGARWTISATMVAAVVGALWLAAARGAVDGIVAMGLIGLGCAPIYIGGVVLIGRTLPKAQFATFSSALVGVGTLGNLSSATPLAYAMATFGWRGTMVGIAALTAVSALVAALVLRDPPREAVAARDDDGVISGLVTCLRMRELWALFPLTLVSYAVLVVVRGLWIGPYLADAHGLDPVARGQAVTVMVVAMIVGAFAYGPLDRVFGTRKWVVAAGTLVSVLALAALWAWPTADLAVAVGLLAVLGAFNMTYGVLMAHGRAFLPDHLLGRGATLLNFLFIGGAGLIQPISGSIVNGLRASGLAPADVYGALFGIYALTLAVALAVYLLARDAPVR